VFEFDAKKFADPQHLIRKLKALNFRVTVWVHPFVSCRAWQFLHYWRRGLLVRVNILSSILDFLSEKSRIFQLILDDVLASPQYRSIVDGIRTLYQRLPITLPGICLWWNGLAGVLDLSNPQAEEEYHAALTRLRTEYDIDSFKFDAGEVNWLPIFGAMRNPLCHSISNAPTDEISTPALYPHAYARLAYRLDTEQRLQEVRVAYRTQKLPVFVRIIDKDSDWTYKNGLRSMLPSIFNLSLLGYPFILPDMVRQLIVNSLESRQCVSST
jgi:myogenesis-regulating glycosidase